MSDAAAGEPSHPAGLLLKWPHAVLAVFCVTLWLPGVLSLPPLDRDESRFAQSSKQMLESGDVIDIRFGQVPRYKKPAGIYWLQAATTAVAGLGHRERIWTYRLPSLIGAASAVWLLFWCARAFASQETAFLAAALLAGTLLLGAQATIATTDAVLLAATLGAEGVLLRGYLAVRRGAGALSLRLTLVGWAAFAIGILVKGPVIAGVCTATVLVLSLWDRDWRWLAVVRPWSGIPLALVIAAPWAIAIALASHGAFYQQALGSDFAAKLAGGQESHGAPPGYYLALAGITFWPATLFLLPAIAAAVRRRAEPAIRFLLAWAGAWWVIVEIIPTKLPHYILPAYPALALLAALWVLTPRAQGEPRWQRALVWLSAFLFALVLALFAAAPFILPRLYGAGTQWWLIAPVALGVGLGAVALLLTLKDRTLPAAGFALVSALVFYPTFTLGVSPLLGELWVSPRAAALVAKDTRSGDPPVALAGYEEPSLVFLLGTETRLTDGTGAAEVGAVQGGLALVDDAERPRFLAHLAEIEADATAVDQLVGFNYSRGKRVHITLYRTAPALQTTTPPQE